MPHLVISVYWAPLETTLDKNYVIFYSMDKSNISYISKLNAIEYTYHLTYVRPLEMILTRMGIKITL